MTTFLPKAFKVIGVRFGGTLLTFPAILPASLTLIQEEGTRRADRDAIGAILSVVVLVIFAMVAEAMLREVSLDLIHLD